MFQFHNFIMIICTFSSKFSLFAPISLVAAKSNTSRMRQIILINWQNSTSRPQIYQQKQILPSLPLQSKMSTKFAVRNIRLCTKDCLCLYVCPTGATDTESSIIDISKCIGCGDCADACPSGAISMVPHKYPRQQLKSAAVTESMKILLSSKSKQERTAAVLPGRLARALELSNRIMAEDIVREAGYMLPQSKNTAKLLESLLSTDQPDDFPAEAVKSLYERFKDN